MQDRATREPEQGFALLMSIFLVLVLMGFSLPFAAVMVQETKATASTRARLQALYVADAGTSDALVTLVPTLASGANGTLGTKDAPIAFCGGSYWVTAADNGNGTCTLVANATYAGHAVAVETQMARVHPLRRFAVFAGNRSGDPAAEFSLSGSGTDADVLNGDLYIHGDITVTGHAEVHGDISATGEITAGGIDGTATPSAAPVAAPDLAAMDYGTIADFKIDATTPFNGDGNLPASDPRHIFVKEFRDDLAASTGFTFSNTNYFLGDPHEGASIANVSVSAAGNNKIYHVDGNLWIEPDGATTTIVDSPPEGTVITVVVRGNIYFADALAYDNHAKDGILFIAMSDGESYHDTDGNHQYDVGEPILHDDGDGVYEGNAEGSGNVCFGDPNGGDIGHIHGFVYAENNFEDYVLDGGGAPLPFEVTGFMSAGEQVRIRRDFGSDHAKMVIHFDDRDLGLPGFPRGGSSEREGLLSWRLVKAAQ